MPERIRTLQEFLRASATVLNTVVDCRAVLFRAGFRTAVPEAVPPAMRELESLASFFDEGELPDRLVSSLHAAGLDGPQLELKLESFEHALFEFEQEGGETNLQDVLDRIFILLNSLAGAIPIAGPLAKELSDFFSKELRRRFRNSGVL